MNSFEEYFNNSKFTLEQLNELENKNLNGDFNLYFHDNKGNLYLSDMYFKSSIDSDYDWMTGSFYTAEKCIVKNDTIIYDNFLNNDNKTNFKKLGVDPNKWYTNEELINEFKPKIKLEYLRNGKVKRND